MFHFPLFSYLPALIAIFPLLVHYLIKSTKHHVHTTPYPIFGHVPQFLRNRHRPLDWFTQLLNETKTNTLVFHSLGDRGVITANPANIEHMLKSDFDNFPKGPRVQFTVHNFAMASSTQTDINGRDAAEYSAGRFWYVIPGFWRVKRFLNIGSERRLKESIAIVHDFATNIIRSRMKELKLTPTKQADDLLSRYIAIEDYSEEFLRDIVISFLLTGRETTSSALSWFFWIVSSRSDVQSRILEEIQKIRGQTSDQNSVMFGLDELREMHYLHAAITESMRLYPPVPTNMLLCMKNTVLPDGTRMKKGEYISYNSYAMGRMEKVWGRDCKEYRPERWLDEDGKFRPESPFKFLAFHAGPRLCLGKEMAYIQMKSIVVCLFDKFVVEIVGKEEVPKQSLSLTLRIKGGLPTRVKYRCR